MLMRTDPFRELDRLTDSLMGGRARSVAMPLTAYRDDDTFVVHLDLPGVSPDSIEATVEQNVLTVHAERRAPEVESTDQVLDERSYGTFTRQLFLGETLDVDALTASYDAGVLTVRVPIAEKAKPRKVEIGTGGVATTSGGASPKAISA